MDDLYNTNIEEIKNEVKSTEETKSEIETKSEQEMKNDEFLNTKLDLLKIYLMCYTLYKENQNEDILKNLIKITILLRKCKEIENHIDDVNKVKDKVTNKRILNDLNKKRYKKTKGNNPRKKFKDRNVKMTEKCTKKYDGKI